MWKAQKDLIIKNKTSGTCYLFLTDSAPYKLQECTVEGQPRIGKAVRLLKEPVENIADKFEALGLRNPQSSPSSTTSATPKRAMHIENEGAKLLAFFSGKDPKDVQNIKNGYCPECAKNGRRSQWNFGRAFSKVCDACGWRDS